MTPPILRSPPFPDAKSSVSVAKAAARELPFGPDDRARAEALRRAMVDARVGGSFWAPFVATAAQAQVVLCPRTAEMAQEMLEWSAVHSRVPASEVLAIVAADRAGAATARWLRRRGVRVSTGPVDPWSLLDGATCLLAADGDERLLLAAARGIPVRRFAVGLGDPAPLDVALELHRHLIERTAYRDVFSGDVTTAEAAIVQLGAWRRTLDINREIGGAVGMARWKHREIRAFLWTGQPGRPRLYRRASAALQSCAKEGRAVAAWPSRVPERFFADAARASVPLWQVEDGFIRSVGLGSALHPPLSIVVDTRGIYYDPTRPSDLEVLLEEGGFSADLLARAERLIDVIVAAGISKYARGGAPVADLPTGGRRVLVTGQVEDDRSVRLGGAPVTGNLDLLRRVRAEEPHAYILFKPHPDVEAGHRKGSVPEAEALRFADRIVRDASMPALLDAVDAVHVWTSLSGFEALLRKREVIVHGTPFFAGWGLTRDLGPPTPRRTRRLSVAELVAGTLILYPRYLDPVTNVLCTPESLIDRMGRPAASKRTAIMRLRAMQGQIRRWMAATRK